MAAVCVGTCPMTLRCNVRVLTASAFVAAPPQTCPDGWTEFQNGNCYKAVAGDFDWQTASSACGMNNTLAAIHDDDTNERLSDLCDAAGGHKAYCWLGLMDSGGDTFEWMGRYLRNSFLHSICA